jgi:hypothetical protein
MTAESPSSIEVAVVLQLARDGVKSSVSVEEVTWGTAPSCCWRSGLSLEEEELLPSGPPSKIQSRAYSQAR